jgi:hypothetical protein
MTTAIRQKGNRGKEAMSGEKIQVCQNCGNRYILIWLNQGEDHNDFGLRHCPFCGLLTDEMTGSVMV